MKFTIILMLFLLGVSGFAKDISLVVDGKSDAVIQSNSTPSAPEFRAAVELRKYLKKVSGAEIPRCTYPTTLKRIVGDNPDFPEILLVTLTNGRLLIPEMMCEKLANAKSRDSFYIKTDGPRIIIAGKTKIGVLYGAYSFLEKYVGVRWFNPGPNGEYCPKSKNITIPEIDDFEEPSIPRRIISGWSKSVLPWTMDEVRDWQIKNKIQFNINHHYKNLSLDKLNIAQCGNRPVRGGGHLVFEHAVPKKLFKTHPEYFPLQNGKRVCKARSQRCLSNPEVRKMVSDFAYEMTKTGAEFLIGYHDSTDGWCQCAKCVEMGSYKGKFTISNIAHKFSSLVAERVLKRNPDASLTTWFYSGYRDLPTDPAIRYDKRVLGLYCPHQRCYVHRLDDSKSGCNEKFHSQFLAWRKICPKMGIFDYYAYSNSPYAPMEYILADDLKLYEKLGLQLWIDDCTNKNLPILSSNWLFYYVAAKMLWDVSLDADELMSNAYDKYYGPAKEPMKKYQALRRELWESAPGHAAYGGPKRIAYCLENKEAEKRLMKYLGEAEKLAGNDGVLQKRIASDRHYLERFWVAEAEKVRERISGQKDIPIQKLNGEIAVDASLDEAAWRKAPLVSGFFTKNGDEPIEETRVKILYDKDNWYFAIEAMTEHAWSPLKAKVTKRDGEVWIDDETEIFIMPPHSDYFHFIINSIGVLYDAKVRDVTFDSKAEIKTKVLKDRYVIEARIPAQPMGMKIADGQTWRMHIYRGCKNLQPPKNSEGSSLDGTPPHEQTLFRRAVVGDNVIINGNFAEIIDTPKQEKGVGSAKFPVHWGGSSAELVTVDKNKNSIKLKDVIYTHMKLKPVGKTTVVSGGISASGKGMLTITKSTCVRPPGDKRPFKHELKEKVATFTLSDEATIFPFQFDLAPYENGYIYIRVKGGEAVINRVNASIRAPESL